jgi:hypothetical protein
VTPSEFKAAFPAFTNTPDPTVQRHITAAAPYFDVDRWGDFYSDGIGNFVAHKIAMENAAAANVGAGDATLKHVGSVIVQRDGKNVGMQMRDPWLRTIYGQEYRRLSRLIGMGGAAT